MCSGYEGADLPCGTPTPPPRVGIALGSNLPPRETHLQQAVERLRALHEGSPSEFLTSSLYETHPVDCPPGSPTFLNAAVELSSDLAPELLLAHLQSIESELGRPSLRAKNSPRTIDLDLLYVGSQTRSTHLLELPHPRIASRAFVLAPLAEISPSLVLPGSTQSILSLASHCGLAGVTRRKDASWQ